MAYSNLGVPTVSKLNDNYIDNNTINPNKINLGSTNTIFSSSGSTNSFIKINQNFLTGNFYDY